MATHTIISKNAELEIITIERVDETGEPVEDYPKIEISLVDLVELVGSGSGNDAKLRETAMCDPTTGATKKAGVLRTDVYDP